MSDNTGDEVPRRSDSKLPVLPVAKPAGIENESADATEAPTKASNDQDTEEDGLPDLANEIPTRSRSKLRMSPVYKHEDVVNETANVNKPQTFTPAEGTPKKTAIKNAAPKRTSSTKAARKAPTAPGKSNFSLKDDSKFTDVATPFGASGKLRMSPVYNYGDFENHPIHPATSAKPTAGSSRGDLASRIVNTRGQRSHTREKPPTLKVNTKSMRCMPEPEDQSEEEDDKEKRIREDCSGKETNAPAQKPKVSHSAPNMSAIETPGCVVKITIEINSCKCHGKN
jgi:hypothetical protein